jgi:hypothetical protein
MQSQRRPIPTTADRLGGGRGPAACREMTTRKLQFREQRTVARNGCPACTAAAHAVGDDENQRDLQVIYERPRQDSNLRPTA